MTNKNPIIVLDVDRMKYPNTGMFEFCYHLYKSFKNNNDYRFMFYKHKKTILNAADKVINIGVFDRFFLIIFSKIDVWHTTNQLSTRIPVNAKKLVYTIHDLNFLYSNKSSNKKKLLLEKIQRNINKADYLTFISEFSYSDVQKNLNIIGKKFQIIYNGVEVEEPKSEPLLIPKNSFLFILGVIDPKKNIHTVLPILEICNFDLIISGKITNKNYYLFLNSEIKKRNLETRVFFTNIISNNDKFWYLKNCSAFLFPSLSEGFGIPPIEAMRFGKPVFLSNLTSLPEIGGQVAYYFDDFEPKKMQKVFLEGMRNFDQNLNKKEEIINWSMQFSWQTSANEYLKVYKELL